MQQPRRTSEFHEEPGTTTKRPIRQPVRHTSDSSVVPGTAPKNTRPSRLALPKRSSSLDRGLNTGSLLGISSTAGQRNYANTPQRTPLNKGAPTPRPLLTTEKKRCASSGALHNDKKWVQDQIHRIADHLHSANLRGALKGFSTDFFTRANNLRQMTIKQFVAIVNYFLRFIWGNRYTVGSNHVDDIVSILQKLRYPHQLNKSWLKTPNTQHSFGNVIVLFDFLMNFVPPDTEEQMDELYFPLQEPHELTANNFGEEVLQVPDVEFLGQMLRHSETGFELWDKQLMEDFARLQQQTCDMLILKKCGIQGTEALNVELNELQKTLDQLEAFCPPAHDEEEKECENLEKTLIQTIHQLQSLAADLDMIEKKLNQLETDSKASNVEAVQLEDEIAQTKIILSKQIYNIEQRNQRVEEVGQLKYMLSSQDRTLRDLQDRSHHQQVLLSRAKKELTDQVQQFNMHMREIAFSQNIVDSDKLEIPLNAKPDDLDQPLRILNALRLKLQDNIEKDKMRHEELERKIDMITKEVESTIESESNRLGLALTAAQMSLQQSELRISEKRNELDNKLAQLKECVSQLKVKIQEYEEMIVLQQQEIEQLKQENTETMANAEKKHDVYVNARNSFLDNFETVLAETNTKLEELSQIVDQNDEKFKSVFAEKKSK